jgi:LysM repeat protein
LAFADGHPLRQSAPISLCIEAGVLARRFYTGGMKRISLLLMTVLMAATMPARAQDAALEERVNKLNGYIQDLREAQDAQRKQIDALAKEIGSLRQQIGKAGEGSATQEDLRKFAEKLQEIDRKREADMERVAKEIESLGKTAAKPNKPVANAETPDKTSPGPANEKGYPYEIKSGDTLSAIVAAYREQGIKVTVDQILKANPSLKATSLKPGQKIFIPAPPQ